MKADNQPIVVALGEILWDLFPTGPRFGGAPANYYAHHASSLGAKVSLVSAVGDDELGRKAIGMLGRAGIGTDHVAIDDKRPTGCVAIEVDDRGQPTYRFNVDEAWDSIPWTPALNELAAGADAVCFGTLSQRSADSRETIRAFVQATRPQTLRILDLNLRPPFFDDLVIEKSLRLANVLKVNDEELKRIADRFISGDGDELKLSEKILKEFDLMLVAVTRGDRGSLLVRDGESSDVAAQRTDINDTVGAGDSYTAAVTVGLLRELGLEEINRAACRIAEYVCSQSGATPRLPDPLTSTLQISSLH